MSDQEPDEVSKAYFLKKLKEARPTMDERLIEGLASIGTNQLRQEIEAEIKAAKKRAARRKKK